MSNHDKPHKVDILGVRFDNVTMLEMVENITAYVENEAQDDNMWIVTANPEIVDYASTHVHYRNLINQADYVVADGTGIVKASKRLKRPLARRIPGIELMDQCLKMANIKRQRVFLLGAKNEVVTKAQRRLQQRYPYITFASHHGYVDTHDETVLKRIKKLNPDYIFVGMGFPKQDEWIVAQQHQFKNTVMMGVGGSFEVFSGMKKRAPKVFRKLNIEWVYRLLIDWKRIGRLKSIPIFMLKVAKTQYKEHKEQHKK
ncbi:WecB/TagA/CpsF family glycosyltransferase [Staphylococcus lugdunensis]|uniref:N-acetylglucosaminyldiphosphoundecaprenol N-acetyl-beta-D-mannosaminyltransferase TarA n=1 Tax=Staphylococcus lugdunensis TaxID=28035 RepID=UPI002264425F|nr:N-acetylglucosaminyldiphosphoundecaprenol N-acetyl-beta-D-mannosaminyltransferase TarA [Staphylococcus lugdunensis]UZW86639.1 WecB/TagA/CpsF family glycosyltransferase [Staphylococcus lugdunensis]